MSLKGVSHLAIASIVFMAAGYLINVWLGRSLGPEAYGIYGIIISLMTTVNIMQTSGLPQATSKFIAEGIENSEGILKSSIILQVISTLILTALFIVLAHPIAVMLNDISLVPYIRLSALVLPLYGIFSLYTYYYNGLRNFKRQALMNIIYSVAKVIAVIGFVYFWHLYGAIIGFIVSPFIALMFGFHWPKVEKLFSYRKLILFSIPLIAFAVISTLQLSIDLFFVKSMLIEDESAGLYSAGQNIARIPFFALSAFGMILFPSISQAVSQNLMDKARDSIRNALRYILILLVPTIAVLASTSEPIIELLYSSKYSAAASSLSTLLVGMGLLTLFMMLANILNGAGKPYRSAIFSGIGILITAISCYILIPRYGLEGAAMATLIGAGVSALLGLVAVYMMFRVLPSWKSLVRIVLGSAIIYWLGMYVDVYVALLPVLYVVMFMIYIGLMIWMKEISKDDLSSFRNLVPKWVPYVGRNPEV